MLINKFGAKLFSIHALTLHLNWFIKKHMWLFPGPHGIRLTINASFLKSVLNYHDSTVGHNQ